MQVTSPRRFQEKILDSGTTSVTLTGAPGGITISGTFDSGTVTQSLPGDSVSIDTFTAEDSFYFNGKGVVFGISGGSGSESISIKWYKNYTPY